MMSRDCVISPRVEFCQGLTVSKQFAFPLRTPQRDSPKHTPHENELTKHPECFRQG